VRGTSRAFVAADKFNVRRIAYMERISAREPHFLFRIIPAAFLGVMGLVVFAMQHWVVMARQGGFNSAIGGGLFLIVLLAIFAPKSRHWVDEVWDLGESLRVRRGEVEVHLPFSQIADVELSSRNRSRYATLVLRQPCILGNRLNFVPRDSWGLIFPIEKCAAIETIRAKLAPNQSKDPTP
jgi:hypothetical protein